MRTLALLSLLLIGCEDRPRTAADGPQLAPDMEHKHLDVKYQEMKVKIEMLEEDLRICSQMQSSTFRQLKECLKGGK